MYGGGGYGSGFGGGFGGGFSTFAFMQTADSVLLASVEAMSSPDSNPWPSPILVDPGSLCMISSFGVRSR